MVIIIGSPKPVIVSRASETHCGPAKIYFGWPDWPAREKVKHDPCKDYNIESIKIIKEKEYIHKEAQKNKKLFDSKDTIRINLLNIQGLSQVKAVELEEMMKTNELLCLTETQQKIEKTKLKKSTKYLTTMRTQEEKKRWWPYDHA